MKLINRLFGKEGANWNIPKHNFPRRNTSTKNRYTLVAKCYGVFTGASGDDGRRGDPKGAVILKGPGMYIRFGNMLNPVDLSCAGKGASIWDANNTGSILKPFQNPPNEDEMYCKIFDKYGAVPEALGGDALRELLYEGLKPYLIHGCRLVDAWERHRQELVREHIQKYGVEPTLDDGID